MPQLQTIKKQADVTHDSITMSRDSRFRAAMVLAIIADALEIVFFPFFFEGAASPADDILDFGIGAVLVRLLGWHWEFLPSFFAKLLPGVDLVPLWTMAVASVYWKSRRSGKWSPEINWRWLDHLSSVVGIHKVRHS